MQVITIQAFQELEKTSLEAAQYFKGRWAYMKVVADIVSREKPQRILEIGATDRPIALGCDTMDRTDNGKPFQLTYAHDATKIPWPMRDKQYDMLIAMQVFEHLGNNQQQCFEEAQRVSKSVVLSLPDRWNCPGDCHHSITPEIVLQWASGLEPWEVTKTPGKRVVYHWRFKE